MTIGTMDSALYVARFTSSDIIKKKEEELEKVAVKTKILTCGLARTDARNAITQEIIVLNSQSKTPACVYIICAGYNGIMDFFLLKDDADIVNEVILEYQRHVLVELPSNCKILHFCCTTSMSLN
jgi:hypothetical protein